LNAIDENWNSYSQIPVFERALATRQFIDYISHCATVGSARSNCSVPETEYFNFVLSAIASYRLLCNCPIHMIK